jgi:putative component of toxin-antitoxin plasmid stabilization module
MRSLTVQQTAEFVEWLDKLKDKRAKRILKELEQA